MKMKFELKTIQENLAVVIQKIEEIRKFKIQQAIELGHAKVDEESPFKELVHHYSQALIWNLTKEEVERGTTYTLKDDLENIERDLSLLDKTDSLIRKLYIWEIMDLSFMTPLELDSHCLCPF